MLAGIVMCLCVYLAHQIAALRISLAKRDVDRLEGKEDSGWSRCAEDLMLVHLSLLVICSCGLNLCICCILRSSSPL
jgi:hypothetical protein